MKGGTRKDKGSTNASPSKPAPNRKPNTDSKSKGRTPASSSTTSTLNRRMITCTASNSGSASLKQPVTILTYNTLKSTVSASLYPHCEESYLRFSYRLPRLIQEIESLAPDIFCLQEVDSYRDFLGGFSKTYDGLYKQRAKGDGCCIFWKRERWYLAKSLECELKWDTVAIIAYLEALSPDESSIIVATTHLVVWQATTEKEKIRSQQTLQVLETLENFKKEVEEEKISRGEDGGTTPIVLCGDFNSPPSSLVYQVVTRQSRKNEKLSLTFKSAYSYYPKLQEAQSESGSSSASEQMFGEPPYTTFVPQHLHWLWIIFFIQLER